MFIVVCCWHVWSDIHAWAEMVVFGIDFHFEAVVMSYAPAKTSDLPET
jgi:hypothetical protein